MHLKTAVLSFLLGRVVGDAFTDKIPSCAVSCVPAALKEAGCSTGDYTCLCNNNIHRVVNDDDVEPCLKKNCSDLSGTQSSIESVCAQYYSGTVTAAATAAATVASAALSSTGTGTATAATATKTGSAGRIELGFGMAGLAALAALPLAF